MIRYYQIATIGFFLTTCMWFSFNKQTENDNIRLIDDKYVSDSLLLEEQYKVKELRKHVRINFILDSINNQNIHTKRMKENHRELLTLTMD